MVFKCSWTRGAQFQSREEEPANSGEPASGATEHNAALAPAIVPIPRHDLWREPNMQQIAADLLVAEKLEQNQISEADYNRQSEHDADEPDAAEDAPDAAEDAPDAAGLRARRKEAKLEEHFNELGAVRFALAKRRFFNGRHKFTLPGSLGKALPNGVPGRSMDETNVWYMLPERKR